MGERSDRRAPVGSVEIPLAARRSRTQDCGRARPLKPVVDFSVADDQTGVGASDGVVLFVTIF